MSDEEDKFPPRILSEEEIEIYLKGDRREVDRLILYSLNRLAACIIPHTIREAKREEEYNRLIEQLGGTKLIKDRADYVNILIKQAKTRSDMMDKVSQSSVVWALLLFLAFITKAVWLEFISAIRIYMGGH